MLLLHQDIATGINNPIGNVQVHRQCVELSVQLQLDPLAVAKFSSSMD